MNGSLYDAICAEVQLQRCRVRDVAPGAVIKRAGEHEYMLVTASGNHAALSFENGDRVFKIRCTVHVVHRDGQQTHGDVTVFIGSRLADRWSVMC